MGIDSLKGLIDELKTLADTHRFKNELAHIVAELGKVQVQQELTPDANHKLRQLEKNFRQIRDSIGKLQNQVDQRIGKISVATKAFLGDSEDTSRPSEDPQKFVNIEDDESNDRTGIEYITFAPGEILFEEHEESYHFFVVQSGQVEIYKTTSDGRKAALAVAAEGMAIGEFAMIDRRPRSATARALTEVHVAKVTENSYRMLLGELPEWTVAMIKSLVERIRHTNEIVRHRASAVPKVETEVASVEFEKDSGDTFANLIPSFTNDTKVGIKD